MSMGYSWKEGFAGIRRQKLAALGSVLTITISLLLLGMFYLVAVQANDTLKQIRAQVDVEVFLKDPIAKATLMDLQKQIQTFEGIATAEYVTKDEAADIFKQEFGEDINKVLDFNPLPSSFKITLKESFRTTERVEQLQKQLKALKGVDDVVYRKDMLVFFDSKTQGLNLIALTLGIFLALSAIILVSNSIRLTIVARRQSIQIMKLVGATRWFIRAPFLVEGIVLGCVGGIVAAGLLFYFISITKNVLPLELSSIVYADVKFYLFLVSAGLSMGIVGAVVSARKYISESVI